MRLSLRLALAGATLGAAVLAASGTASAQGALQGGRINLELQLPFDGKYRVATEQERIEFFDLAHCECADADEATFLVKLSLSPETPGNLNHEVEIWVGQDCDDTSNLSDRNARCELIDTIPDVDTLVTPTNIEVPVRTLMFPNGGECQSIRRTQTFYAIIDPDQNNMYAAEDVFPLAIQVDTRPPPAPTNITKRGGENSIELRWDIPAGQQEDIWYYQALCVRRGGVDGGTDSFPDLDPRYDTPELVCPDAFPAPPRASAYAFGGGGGYAFGGGDDAGLEPDAGGPDGGVADAGPQDGGPDGGTTPEPTIPEDFEGLPPELLCGESGGGQNSLRISGLQNLVEYEVLLLVIDRAGNYTPIPVGTARPEPVRDFWEHYDDAGGSAEGGFCLINSAYGDQHPFTTTLRDFRDGSLASSALGRGLIEAYYQYLAPLGVYLDRSPALRAVAAIVLAPVVAVAALWTYTPALVKLAVFLGLAWLLRRRRTRHAPAPRLAVAVAASAALLLIGAGTASAQQSYSPYWDRYEDDGAPAGPPVPEWAFEFKLGPYLPGIDKEFEGSDRRPFAEMFGGDANVMSVIELDRFFLYPAGQLGVSLSAGFVDFTAHSYRIDTNGKLIDRNGNVTTDPSQAQRVPEDTSFRMIPTSLGLVYRFTHLDDRYGIPFVPYGKAGLSYYIWWITAPGGSTAQKPTADCPNPGAGCDGERARGASLGYQASLGLSFRAERLDRQAAINLRNELGVEHVGFFAEATYANVDGFGRDNKLTVGDFTWFAGINFEF